MRCHRIHIVRPIQDLKSISIQEWERGELVVNATYVGFERINDDELMELKAAIDEEVLNRKEKSAKRAEAELGAHIKQVLNAGFNILISTNTDEITLEPGAVNDVCVEAFPVV